MLVRLRLLPKAVICDIDEDNDDDEDGNDDDDDGNDDDGAGDAVGRRMRNGDADGAEPKNVLVPATPSLMMGEGRAIAAWG